MTGAGGGGKTGRGVSLQAAPSDATQFMQSCFPHPVVAWGHPAICGAMLLEPAESALPFYRHQTSRQLPVPLSVRPTSPLPRTAGAGPLAGA